MIYCDTRIGYPPQNHNDIETDVNPLCQFRQELHASFDSRADGIMNLLDALSSNTQALSVAELSLNPIFNYQYASVYDAIDQFFSKSTLTEAERQRRQKEIERINLILSYLPAPQCRRFWLFALDTTKTPRPDAHTLADRGIVYQPNPIGKNKPITIGHQYAALVYLPEKLCASAPPWVVPLSMLRVKTQNKATELHAQQLMSLFSDSDFDCEDKDCVCVVDSTINTVPFLATVRDQPQLVTIGRTRGNRVFFHPPQSKSKKRGHPRWYGQRFALKEQETWTPPDEQATRQSMTRRGRKIQIELLGWHNLLMRGKRQQPMHHNPFTLIRVMITDTCGKPVFKRPLWLTVTGQRRDNLSILERDQAYRQRFDIEHFFRFGKQKLLTTSYQTPDVEHEENWWQLTSLAYVQLFLARHLAESLPRPWERYLPQYRSGESSPSVVQRDFGRIIRTIEPLAVLPKPRGKSPGRQQGDSQERRERQKVIKKANSAAA